MVTKLALAPSAPETGATVLGAESSAWMEEAVSISERKELTSHL